MSVKSSSARAGLRRAVVAGFMALACATALATARADYADGVYAVNHISLEVAVRVWRKAAWQGDDFLAEMRLADIYANASDSRFYDPTEAYVWFYLASRNRTVRDNYRNDAVVALIAERRDHAVDKQGELLLNLTPAQRADAHDRIVYIYACRGADGFIELGRISTTHPPTYGDDDDDFDFGGGGARGRRQNDFQMLGITTRSVMVPNDAEALTYFHVAESMGNPIARAYMNALEGRLRGSALGARVVERQSKTFHYWFPPYEFYPAGDSASGVPLTDECVPTLERQRALAMAAAIPAAAEKQALAFLGWKGRSAVVAYQASLPDEATGRLTAGQLVRAIQTAALDGDAASQNTLGVMYAKGLGVVTNYVRAEYWFAKSADQRYPAALYHLGVLYKAGPPGIDQDLHKANDYMTNSAIAGFRPTMNQLSALLNAAANAPPRPGQN